MTRAVFATQVTARLPGTKKQKRGGQIPALGTTWQGPMVNGNGKGKVYQKPKSFSSHILCAYTDNLILIFRPCVACILTTPTLSSCHASVHLWIPGLVQINEPCNNLRNNSRVLVPWSCQQRRIFVPERLIMLRNFRMTFLCAKCVSILDKRKSWLWLCAGGKIKPTIMLAA
jgi:hypothetical protein